VIPRLRQAPRIARNYRDRIGPYSALVERINGGRTTGTAPRGPVIVGLRPAGDPIDILERRKDVLIAGAQRGHQAVVDAFE
jgi:hypothetical protein